MVSNSSAEPDGLKITFTVDQVRDKLLKLQENKLTGPGGFHPMVMSWQLGSSSLHCLSGVIRKWPVTTRLEVG